MTDAVGNPSGLGVTKRTHAGVFFPPECCPPQPAARSRSPPPTSAPRPASGGRCGPSRSGRAVSSRRCNSSRRRRSGRPLTTSRSPSPDRDVDNSQPRVQLARHPQQQRGRQAGRWPHVPHLGSGRPDRRSGEHHRHVDQPRLPHARERAAGRRDLRLNFRGLDGRQRPDRPAPRPPPRGRDGSVTAEARAAATPAWSDGHSPKGAPGSGPVHSPAVHREQLSAGNLTPPLGWSAAPAAFAGSAFALSQLGGLPQPATTPQQPGHAHPDTVREHPHRGMRNPVIRLHETKGRPPTSGAQVTSMNVASALVVPALACGSPTVL
jgi:hypothetical protein